MKDFHGNERFEVLRELGAGGMGFVHEAIDHDLNIHIALKTLRRLDGDSLYRMKEEFRSLRDVQHPNLVRLGELIEDQGAWMFTMELVEGIDWLSYVRGQSGEGSATMSVDVGRTGDDLFGQLGLGAARDVDGEQTLDESRLRTILPQLARALVALHERGKVHRDIKPSNVLVTRTGRVVVLDFGLLSDTSSEDHRIRGTPAYMAPEQLDGGAVGPAADWYACGVMLYQALTGAMPFEGDPKTALALKRSGELRPPSALAGGVPPDLDALCLALLSVRAENRPSGREVLQRLDAGGDADVTEQAPFVGRSAELERLGAALDDARRGGCRLLLVRGEPGVGKSFMVKRFAEAAHTQGALVLSGRCYEREAVPFKAFDGVIDSLSQVLAAHQQASVAALLPPEVGVVAQVFPVLARVPAIASVVLGREAARDPSEQRHRVFAALRAWWHALARVQTQVIVLDDMQWADRDSLALLAELLRRPDAPPLLVIATLRPGAEIEPALLSLVAPGDVLEVGPLAGGEAPELVQAREASRIAELSAEEQRLLEAVSVAGRPVRQSVVASATGFAAAALETTARRLAELHLVQRGGLRGSDRIEPYHDRVRSVVLARVDDARRREWHAALARAIAELAADDLEALADHWDGAGEAARAAEVYRRAAQKAERMLAFDRAAFLWGRAIVLGRPQGEDARACHLALGDALAAAGRGPEAAEAYLAARRDAGDHEASILAAHELLRAGHLDEGLAIYRDLLQREGIRLPESSGGAIASMLARRTWFRLFGGRPRERKANEQVPARLLRQADLFWSLGTGLAYIDPVRALEVGARHVIVAFRSGEPTRCARAIAMEIMQTAPAGTIKWAETQQGVARALEYSRRVGSPYALALTLKNAASAEFFVGQFRDALRHYEEAEEIFSTRCTRADWELSSLRMFMVAVLFFLGELPELARRVSLWRRQVADRGNIFAATSLRVGLSSIPALAQGEPERARVEAEQAMARWSRERFLMEHAYELYALTHVDMYVGAPHRALERWQAAEAAYSKSFLDRVQSLRLSTSYHKARVTLGAALVGGPDAAALRASAEARVAQLLTEDMGWLRPLAGILAARLCEQDKERASALLETAATQADLSGMKMFAAIARRAQGAALGDEAKVAEAERTMRDAGVRDPVAFARALTV